MRLQHILGAAAVCTLYLGAATHPVNNLKTLDSRGRFPGGEPKDPAPKNDPIPGLEAGAGTGTSSGAPNLGQALAFQLPASFTKDIGKGKGVEADLKAAKDPDANSAAVKDYPANIKNYKVADSDTKVLLDIDWLKELANPFKDLDIDGNTDFREALIYAGEHDPVHEGYYSHGQKTAVMSDLDNSRYAADFTGDKVFQSQILYVEWSKEAAGDVKSLQWVARADIANTDTQAIIKDAQTATKGSVQTDTQVTFSAAAADDSAEKASFDALAGSDNGRMVFKMLTDNHETMGGKTVVAAHTWVLQAGSSNPWFGMVWELSI